MDSGRLVQFSVINQRTLTPVEWEVSEVGVECDGIDDYITMDAVTSSLVRGAFAFGLWVFPYKDPRPHKDLDVVASEPVYLDSPPETSGPPSAPTNRGRRLQQTFDGRPSSKRHSAARRRGPASFACPLSP